MQRINATSLRLFVRVVEEGSIAAAAEREHVVAAGISKRLTDLESTLGIEVLRRNNKGVEPTAAGLALMALARRALHELDQIPLQMQAYASGLRGMVRVFASMSAVTQFLPEDIAAFQDLHPDVQIQLEETTSTAVVRAVTENAADIGILIGAVDEAKLQIWPYRHDELVLCMPRDHRLAMRQSVAFSEVVDEAFVGVQLGGAIDLLLARAVGLLDRSLHVRNHAASFDAQCMMIHAGLGLGVTPATVAHRHAAALDLAIAKLSDTWAQRTFRVAVRRDGALPAAAESLVLHLRKSANISGGHLTT